MLIVKFFGAFVHCALFLVIVVSNYRTKVDRMPNHAIPGFQIPFFNRFCADSLERIG